MIRVYRVDSVRYPGQRAADPDFGLLLGRKGGKWPDEGMPVKHLDGSVYRGKELPRVACMVAVWVLPKPEANGRKSSKHRIMCRCPGCGETVPLGRLGQHRCK